MNLFGNREVIVGTPSGNQDKHRHQPNGDSVIAIEHARHEYEEEMRRQRPREIAEKIFEWALIVVAVVGFGAFVLLTAASLTKQHGIAVPISIVAAVIVVLFANRKHG